MRRVGATLPAAAQYLGVSEAQLRAQLRSGRTLAQVAAAHGHSRDAARRRHPRLPQGAPGRRPPRGQITATEERAAVKLLRRRIERAVDRRI